MLTQRLFRRAAVLAAQGKLTEQESAAILRHILLYDNRPCVFDALLILSPLTEPAIILRFLKAYRHQDVVRALALLKECGRGDLSDVGVGMLTMYPERYLPRDGYGRDTFMANVGEGSASSVDKGDETILAHMGHMNASSINDALGDIQAIDMSKEAAAASYNGLSSATATLGEIKGRDPFSGANLTVHSLFPFSSITVRDMQALVCSNHSDQKTPEEMLEESERRASLVASLQSEGFSPEAIAKKLSENLVDELDPDMVDLLGKSTNIFVGNAEERDMAHVVNKTLHSVNNPIILDVDTKWSGLMEAAAEADGLKPIPEEGENNDAPYSPPLESQPGVEEGLSPEEKAILEEERRAVEAFEKAKEAAAGGNSSTSDGGFGSGHGDAHTQSLGSGWGGLNNDSNPAAEYVDDSASTPPASSSDEMSTTNGTSIVGGNGSVMSWGRAVDEEATLMSNAAKISHDLEAVGLVVEDEASSATETNAAAESEQAKGKAAPCIDPLHLVDPVAKVPVCPLLPPTPVSDFENFFKTRIGIAAEKLVYHSKRGVIPHERFFLLGKFIAQMQSINPEAIQKVVTRGNEILGQVLEGRSKLWRDEQEFSRKKGKGKGNAKGSKKKKKGSDENDTSVASASGEEGVTSTAQDSSGASSSGEPSTTAATTTADNQADNGASGGLSVSGETKTNSATKNVANESSIPSQLVSAVLTTLTPSPVVITPSYAVSVACVALDFFAIALITSTIPSYSVRLALQRVKGAVASEGALRFARKAESRENPSVHSRTSASNESTETDSYAEAMHVVGMIHRGTSVTAMAVLNMREHTNIGGIAKALRAYVVLIKAGFAVDRTIPMAHILLEEASKHVSSMLGEAHATDLERLISLVQPVRSLCTSNRFPDARVLRVKLATSLQAQIFNADDELFYRFCSIAIAPESGLYGLTPFTGQQRLRLSRVLAFADSAFSRPIPSTPGRLAIACELLRSVGRRRFGLARHAIFHASRTPPRTLRDYINTGRMIHYATIHPELFNRSHGGYMKLLHVHSDSLGASIFPIKGVAEELSGRKHASGSDSGADGSGIPNSLVAPMNGRDILRLELGIMRLRRMEMTDRSIEAETVLREREDRVRAEIAQDATPAEMEGRIVKTADGKELEAADNSSRGVVTDVLDLARRTDFSCRLFQNVGPYRNAIVAAFGNEPFLLNWFIANQDHLYFNTLVSCLRTLSKSEDFLKEQLRQYEMVLRNSQAAEKLAEAKERGKDGSLEIDESNPTSPSHFNFSTSITHDGIIPQYQQLVTFLLAVIRFRLLRLHMLGFKKDPESTAGNPTKGKENQESNLSPEDKTKSPKITASNTGNFVTRNRSAAYIYKIVSEEVLGIIPNFAELPETAKVHARAIMSTCQRTNPSGYGALIIEHGKGFSRAVFGAEKNAAISNRASAGGKLSRQPDVKLHMSLNFNKLLDENSLRRVYSLPQMIRLVGLLHEYHVTYKNIANVDAGRLVLPSHWEAIVKALRYRCLHDESPVDNIHASALLKVASRVVHETLADEVAALEDYRDEEVARLRSSGITTTEAINEHLRTLKLPADRIDQQNLKAIEAIVSITRWICASPPEEQQSFSAEQVAHLFKLLMLPAEGSNTVRQWMAKGHMRPALTIANNVRETVSAVVNEESGGGKDEGHEEAKNTTTNNNNNRDGNSAPRGPMLRGSTVLHRINLGKHFHDSSFHSQRVRGATLPPDTIRKLIAHANYSIQNRKTFDHRVVGYLGDIAEGRERSSFALMKAAFAENCTKPPIFWDNASVRAQRAAIVKKISSAKGSAEIRQLRKEDYLLRKKPQYESESENLSFEAVKGRSLRAAKRVHKGLENKKPNSQSGSRVEGRYTNSYVKSQLNKKHSADESLENVEGIN